MDFMISSDPTLRLVRYSFRVVDLVVLDVVLSFQDVSRGE